ncbi:MAG TPA: SOS response-associated peptidase family protein [Edaphobacter sp.]|nr:SOS response-associated peptidase family protein [Edaphobacter sp.]
MILDIGVVLGRGFAHLAKGDLEAAERDFSEVIRLEPSEIADFMNRGQVRACKGDIELAEEDFSKAVQLKPNYAEAFIHRGTVRVIQSDFGGAEQDFSETIQLKPDQALAFHRRKPKDGTPIESFTITTTIPNSVMETLHDRMPCIPDRSLYRTWLEPGGSARPPIDLLRPYAPENMHYWPVGQRVGNVRNDDRI